MKNLRQLLAKKIVEVNLISPELADQHVHEMTDGEVLRRLNSYARNLPRAEGQDAVVIQTGKTVVHSVPVLDAANKPTTADRKSEASLPSADSCQTRSSPHPAKVESRNPEERLAWVREMVRRAREGWPDGQGFLPLSRPGGRVRGL
jgi:hypothetical protein